MRQRVQMRLGAGSRIESVTRTPYLGLFEVCTGNGIVYTDVRGEYLFVGNVVNARTSQDYTRERTEALSRIRFADLPLESALKQVKGNGSRRIAIFEDPNCGYCRKLREELQGLNDVTLYTFMYNILSDESTAISRNIWCASDPVKAWDDWMLRHENAPDAAAGCTTPSDQVLALGQKIKVNGTPTLIFADGSRVAGAMDLASIQARLASAKAPR